ncbi:MAG: pilus assembly protein, partial [Caulobacterales bacterium]|nr:pilus assembly protein [Caulobacterales bacterium]
MFSNSWNVLKGNERGNITVTFALSFLPCLCAIGSAIDYSNMLSTRTDLQATVDFASLAGASLVGATDSQREAAAEDYLRANFPAALAGATFDVVSDRVEVAVSVDKPTTFMQLLHVESLNIQVSAQALIPEAISAEVALVVDYSYSMASNNKYVTMRDAAIDMINDLSSASGGAAWTEIKFAVVPFSDYVYTDMEVDHIAGVHSDYFGTSVRTCLDSRRHPYATQSTTPDTLVEESRWPAPEMSPDASVAGGSIEDDDFMTGAQCHVYEDNHVRVRPLTTDYGSLTAQLHSMTPIADTNIALGVEMGWHVLTQNDPFDEGEAP